VPVPPSNVESIGKTLALLLREAAVQAVLSVLSNAPVGSVDRWALLEGKPPAEALRREVCACFAASIYRASQSIGESHRAAAAKVEVTCKHAFADAGPSATEIGSYIASDAPAAALATRVAALLGCDGDAHALRTALTSSHSAFGEKLVLAHRAV
jgi:hypothetical protein